MQRKLLIALLLVQGDVALAADTLDERPSLSFAAFGTLGVVHSDERDADFGRSAVIPTGAGRSEAWASNVDSLLGAQVTATAGSKLSAVVQVVAAHGYDDSFSPDVEWANLKYEFTPDFSVRAGRTASPIFMFTESRHVGFALPWIRTPQEIYDVVPVTRNDGVDLTWKMPVSAGQNTFQLAVGRSDTPYLVQGERRIAQSRDQIIAADTFDIGELSLRANYGQAHLTVDVFRPLFDGFRQFAALGGTDIASHYEMEGRIARYMGLSVSYQPGDWFAMAEWGRLKTDALLGNRLGWYVTGGHRFGAFTPYVTYGDLRVTSNLSDPGLPTVASLPAASQAAVGYLNTVLNAALNAAPRQSTTTAGVRFDVARGLSLKAQYDYLDLHAGSSGTLSNLRSDFHWGGVVHLVSLSMDFVL